jgi:hypothetical protein
MGSVAPRRSPESGLQRHLVTQRLRKPGGGVADSRSLGWDVQTHSNRGIYAPSCFQSRHGTDDRRGLLA